MESKKEVRQTVRNRKSFYSSPDLLTLSIPPLFGLESDPDFIQAEHVAMYWSCDDEVNTHAFIERWHKSKKIYLPVVKHDDISFVLYRGETHMTEGPYGIKEPVNQDAVDAKELDVIVVPGVAFDTAGHRLGRGKGYYDRFLAGSKATKIGIAFPFQMFESIPTESHDISLDKVII